MGARWTADRTTATRKTACAHPAPRRMRIGN